MSPLKARGLVGQREVQTQRRVVAFFRDALGHWQDRPDNRNIERELVTDWLKRQGHGDKIIDKALFALNKAAKISTTLTAMSMVRAEQGSKNLYDANRDVYDLLGCGVGPLDRAPAQRAVLQAAVARLSGRTESATARTRGVGILNPAAAAPERLVNRRAIA